MSSQDRFAPSFAVLVGVAAVAYLAAMLWALGYLGDPAVRWLTGEGYYQAARRFGLGGLPHLISGLYLVLLATGGLALLWLMWLGLTQVGALVLHRLGGPR